MENGENMSGKPYQYYKEVQQVHTWNHLYVQHDVWKHQMVNATYSSSYLNHEVSVILNALMEEKNYHLL